MKLLLQVPTLMLRLILMAGDTGEDTTVLMLMATTMAREVLTRLLLPLVPILMLRPSLTTDLDTEDTTVHTAMVATTTARDKLRMRLLLLVPTLMLRLILMAGDTGEDTTVLMLMATTMAREVLTRLLLPLV